LEANIVVLNPKDNVATTLAPLKAGQVLELPVGGRTVRITLAADVPFGHKFGLTQIAPGAEVIKYGEVIGTATVAIRPGDYVHVHNVASGRGRGDLAGGAK
jgi:altronate dehydratase small subunit